ncbi:MAG: hypothetical protein LQ350_001961 [Teloschistes chrysophthalmus]|nr:MAG: hypothetical protein LQ350_001961 [Niorma chrysophthalma]
MPHFIRNSIAESPASASTSLSFSSPPRQPSDSSPWLDIELEDIQGPEYPGSRIKRLRTALSSPSLSPTQGIAHVTERKTFQSATTAQAPSTPPRFMQKQSAVEDVSYLPTPPDSQHSGGSEDSLLYSAIPGPLLQSPLTPPSSNVRSRRSLRRPWIGTTPILASTTSPDRYISSRSIPQDSSGSFRLGKAPHLLSPDEKLLRNHSATPDPFLSSPRRTRHGRALTSSIDSRSATRSQARSTSSQDGLLTPHHAHPPPQYRQASLGTIWNVGGGPHQPTGPVQGISDGRGGLIGSGTNSPLYTAKFSEKDAPEDDQEIYENRLAAALDIDRTRKVLDLSRPGPQKAALLSTKRKRGTFVGRTQWRYGEWAREGDISPVRKVAKQESKSVPTIPFRVLDAPALRDDYYCSVLAYCHTSRTLAVGLSNKVYLWSEAFGVQYPKMEESMRRTTYVTSLSFSSTDGGHSILAIGRNSGHISLRSLFDEGTRFESQQPSAVACLSFKPVTTRRTSTRLGMTVATEELLAGDEMGNVYYYAVEWVDNQKVEVHGWHGAMTLLAKISVHSQQICGLAWSPSGEYFATGANDNACCLFNAKELLSCPENSRLSQRRPLRTLRTNHGPSDILSSESLRRKFALPGHSSSATEVGPTSSTQRASSNPSVLRAIPGQNGILNIGEGHELHRWLHSAAIKAIAFCPWQPSLLATGGGSNDRAIHFYHTLSGACLATIDVQAQVTSLIWSTTRREIAATFGYAQPEHPYRIAVFSWPECRQVVAIPWANEMRALHAIPYPGGPSEKGKKNSASAKEGEAWWGRTRVEGCIVVACSDESVKFHEVWTGKKKSVDGSMKGMLGGSGILEGLEGCDGDGGLCIR